MIDYGRLEKGLSGVEPSAKAQPDVDPLTAYELENSRLKKVIDVQKAEIKRLMRLLGIGLQLR
jgi:predicted DNA-binding helix-hairpin-helix protein